MTQRQLHVIHVLAACGTGEARRFLFYPHDRWVAPDSALPYLALPTRKIAADSGAATVGGGALRRAFVAVMREDLGLTEGRPTWERRLPRATLEMCSPTRKVATEYAIWPVVVSVDAARHDALRARLGGEWLTDQEALRQPHLSPTARRVLERADLFVPAPAGKPARPTDDWTLRLLGARGCVSDFGTLFEEVKPWLRARLRTSGDTGALFRAPDDVEDVLQDAALDAVRHLKRFNPCLGSAGTWLWTITHNRAVSFLRRRRIRAAVSLYAEDGQPFFEIAAPACDPAELAEGREEHGRAFGHIEEALELCGPEVRMAWELRFRVGLSYEDIAREMGRPVGTIATWIHRVKRVARRLGGMSE